MGKINFNQKRLEALKPPEGRAAFYRDSGVRGLGIKIEPTGHRAFFWTRKAQAKPLWITIGEAVDLSVEQARDAATRHNKELADWKARRFADPNPFAKAREKDALTLDGLVNEYVTRHLAHHAKNPPKAERELRWMFGKHLSDWGGRKLGKISEEDVAERHRKIGAKHHRTANHVVMTLRTIFNFAIRAKLFKGENPALGVTFYSTPPRERFLSTEELPKFWAALKGSASEDFRDYVVIAMFTGARKGDVFSMRWADVSLSRNVWTVPDPKSRTPYVVPLDAEVVEVLKRRLAARINDNEFVFPGFGETGHIVDLKKHWKELVTKAGLVGVRQHDMRRTFASHMAIRGTSLQVIGRALGHKSLAATSIYAKLHVEAIREATEASNAVIRAAMKPKPQLLPAPATAKKRKAARG